MPLTIGPAPLPSSQARRIRSRPQDTPLSSATARPAIGGHGGSCRAEATTGRAPGVWESRSASPPFAAVIVRVPPACSGWPRGTMAGLVVLLSLWVAGEAPGAGGARSGGSEPRGSWRRGWETAEPVPQCGKPSRPSPLPPPSPPFSGAAGSGCAGAPEPASSSSLRGRCVRPRCHLPGPPGLFRLGRRWKNGGAVLN